MIKIEEVFINKYNKKALIPYIVAGHPSLSKSLTIMHTLVANGADIIELGVPFSDPMADGVIIQNAIQEALKNNISLFDVLNLVKQFRKNNTFTPIILMGYLNPILRIGYKRFAQLSKESGINGVLVVDCPFEHIQELKNYLSSYNIDCIFLIAPTTSIIRVKQILKFASGFLYYVSLKGVTGSDDLDLNQVRDKVIQLKNLTKLPIVVGFGIKDNKIVRDISEFADGVVIGSYIVDEISKNKGNEEQTIGNIIKRFNNII